MSFSLKLANNLSWQFMAFGSAVKTAAKMAHIMRLKDDKTIPPIKIILLPKQAKENPAPPLKHLPAVLRRQLPSKNWEKKDDKIAVCWSHPKCRHILFELMETDKHALIIIQIWRVLGPIFEKIIETGGLPFHAGLVVKDKKGYILAGPGNIGKSTACRRIPRPWRDLCDDECIIVRLKNGHYRVHPFPTWSAYLWDKRRKKSWLVERSVELAALCFLEQAKRDKISPLGKGLTATRINQSCRQSMQKNLIRMEKKNPSLHAKIFSNACQLSNAVDAYKLKVKLTGRFWEEMERVLVASHGASK
jgi:SynChlorMet cassette protein ScmC